VRAAGNTRPEPSSDYLEALHVFDSVVRECITVSKQYGGIPSRTSKHFYASVLFTSLIARGVSLVILAPHSTWADKMIEHWDYASAAIIVRTILELRAAFHYLCIDPCSDEEWECRWNLLNLHDSTTRKRLTELRNANPEEVARFDAQAQEIRERLRANTHFQCVAHQKKLLNGQTPYLYSIEDMAEKAGVEIGTYRFLHIVFSSHVHGLPMSYFRLAEQETGRGLPSPIEESHTSICLTFAATLLAATRDEIHALFGALREFSH
jgi:hypothetical protein